MTPNTIIAKTHTKYAYNAKELTICVLTQEQNVVENIMMQLGFGCSDYNLSYGYIPENREKIVVNNG